MTDSEAFIWAHKFVAKWEGGISDDKNDPGGYTCYGVCMRFLQDFVRERPRVAASFGLELPLTREMMATQVSRSVAASILKIEFWPRIILHPDFSLIIYDSCVNCGKSTGIRFAQQTLNDRGANLETDGVLGPKTAAWLMAEDHKLAKAIIEKRRNYYEKIVQKNPKLISFRKGWLNRLDALQKYLNLP